MTQAFALPAGTADLAPLEQLVEEVDALQSKLVLLVGSGKTHLLRTLAQRWSTAPVNLGVTLGRRLAATPASERGFLTNALLREIADDMRGDAPLLLDNLEVLFEPSLGVNPLNVVKGLAHSRRVVAAWPGDMRDDRLTYARMGHLEYRDHTRDGTVVLETTQGRQGAGRSGP